MANRRAVITGVLAVGVFWMSYGTGSVATRIVAGGTAPAEGPDQSSTSLSAISLPPIVPTSAPPATTPTTTPTTTPPTGPPESGERRTEPCPTPPGKYSQAQIVAARPQVEAMVADNFSAVGNGANAIGLELLTGREQLASQVLARFGDIVEIKVGETAYCGAPGTSRTCEVLPGTDALPPGLGLSLRLEASSIKATDRLSGELVIRNDSPTIFEMETGQPLVAAIVRPGTRTVVGTYSGAIAGTGYGLRLSNGQSDTIRVIVGTSRCDGERGSALPPGRYGVRVGIGHNEGPPGLLAPEVPLTILGP